MPEIFPPNIPDAIHKASRALSRTAVGNAIYDLTAQSIDGTPVPIAGYRGNVLLVVNTASHCGFTPQYRALDDLYRQFKDRGLVVLGFPCNQFGAQEPGTATEIAQFCERNYGVSFPIFSKVDVNGPNAHPLFKLLKQQQGGIFGPVGFSAIKWNFTKFLVDRNGKIVGRYAPATPSAKLIKAVEALLD